MIIINVRYNENQLFVSILKYNLLYYLYMYFRLGYNPLSGFTYRIEYWVLQIEIPEMRNKKYIVIIFIIWNIHDHCFIVSLFHIYNDI